MPVPVGGETVGDYNIDCTIDFDRDTGGGHATGGGRGSDRVNGGGG